MNVSFALCFPVSKSACFTIRLTQDLLGFFLSLRFLNENNDALRLSKERNSELVTNTVVKLCMASRSRIGDILILEEDLGKSKSYPKMFHLAKTWPTKSFQGDSQRGFAEEIDQERKQVFYVLSPFPNSSKGE